MTANELITPALRLIGVLQETESASAEQASTGLVTLNDMMADLASDDVDIGYAPQSDPNADVGINIEARQPLKFMLAALFCADYERPVPPLVATFAVSGRTRLLRQAIYQTRRESTMTHVPLGEASGLGENILIG
jgi:hypothetical protein